KGTPPSTTSTCSQSQHSPICNRIFSSPRGEPFTGRRCLVVSTDEGSLAGLTALAVKSRGPRRLRSSPNAPGAVQGRKSQRRFCGTWDPPGRRLASPALTRGGASLHAGDGRPGLRSGGMLRRVDPPPAWAIVLRGGTAGAHELDQSHAYDSGRLLQF